MQKQFIFISLFLLFNSCDIPFGKQNTDDRELNSPNRDAQFPGGVGSMKQFIAENTTYPEQAIENKIEGEVMVNFTVEKDGRLTDITPLNGHKILRREAFKTVSKMPRWLPSKVNNKPVRTKCRLPIKFRLD